jgi:hypothetical protein
VPETTVFFGNDPHAPAESISDDEALENAPPQLGVTAAVVHVFFAGV